MIRNAAFSELQVACNNFSADRILGRGGFGVVYRGKWNGQGRKNEVDLFCVTYHLLSNQ